MDRVYEKEKSSRKTRDERERDKESTKDHHRDHHDRDREYKHRSSRDGRSRDSIERHHNDKYREEKHRDNDRYRSKDHSHDHEESKRERSQEPTHGRDSSRDEREELVERRTLSSSHKRKERGDSEERFDKSEKRVRASKEEKRERRKFEDDDSGEDFRDLNGTGKEEKRERRKFEDGNKEEAMRDGRVEKRERRRFGDKAKEEDVTVVDEVRDNKQADANNVQSNVPSNGSGSKGAALEPLEMASSVFGKTSSTPDHPLPTKVSSISSTNENKGVSIARSHEVPGKSSTDGTTTSAAPKSGNLSLEALEKAKRALQMQKKLSEKLKKMPLLNKVTTSSSDATALLGQNKDGPKALAPSGVHHGSMALATPVQPSTSTLSGAASSVTPSGSGMANLPGLANGPNYEAVKRAQELAAKMGFHQDPEFAPLINMFPGQMPVEVAVQQKPAKAPVLRLDALGREIDEHGNVINMPKLTNLSTLKVNINKQKKEAFQILKPDLDVDPESNPHYDERMGINKEKLLRPKRMNFQFVEEGRWARQAEIIRIKSQFGEAQAKELKMKQAQLAKAKAEPDINPNLIEVSERIPTTREKPKDPIPEVEWWDVLLLPSGNYGDITGDNIAEDKLKMDKITVYVEHPLPIEPPAEPAPPPPQPLKLTKQEQKKLRTQRRLAKEKDRQEMIRQGLLEPPKAKIKMSNLMRVLGSEATQDPTRLEMKIRNAAAEREQAHVDRNIARKLTPAERREKKQKKLFDDPSTLETIVSIYKIHDLSHRQTRWKVDVNAQENKLTGSAVIADGISVVVVEGSSKAIKRYGKLMLRRINWAAAVATEEENEDEDEDKPENKCVLVWQGSVARPSFNKFFVQECRTEAAARKYFSDAGVGHYWDLAVNFSDDQI